MKKIIAIVLSMLLVFGFATTALADKVQTMTHEGSADVLVTLNVNCRFRVVIPEQVAFDTEGGDTLISVRAYGLYLWNGSRLNVTVRSANDWELKDEKDHFGYTAATLNSKEPLQNGDRILSVPSGTTFARQVLNLTLDEEVMTAGEFTDKLTFVLSIDEA